MRLKFLLILGPILVIAGLGMNATMGQNKDDDPLAKKGPPKKDDRKGPKDDRKGPDDRTGPKDGRDHRGGPPPRGDHRPGPGGPLDLMRTVDHLDLSKAQREKAHEALKGHHEKMRQMLEKAQKDALADLKKILPAEEYRKLENAMERHQQGPPRGDRKMDRKGPPKGDRKDDRKGPKEDGKDDDGKGPPKKDRKGPPKDDQEEVGITERISAPRIERDGDQ